MGITSKPECKQGTIELGWKGKGVLASICGIVLIAAFFALQHAGGAANANLPNDIAGTCTVEYIDSATLPATGEVSFNEEVHDQGAAENEGGNSETTIENEDSQAAGTDAGQTVDSQTGSQHLQQSNTPSKHVYKVTMPDDTKIIAYGTHDGYIPKDGQYPFSGTFRSDNGYNIVVNTAYNVASLEDIHAASTELFLQNGEGVTQMLDEFIWTPDEDYDTNQNEVPSGVSGNDVSSDEASPTANNNSNASADDHETNNTNTSQTNRNYDMVLKATAIDKANQSHEGCADKEDVVISVDFTYENLFSNNVFTLKGALVDQFDNAPILDINGSPIVIEVPFETKNAYEPTEADINAQSVVDSFLDAAQKVIDSYYDAGSSEDRSDEFEGYNALFAGDVPQYTEIEEIVNRAKDEGPSILNDATPYLNEFYSYYNSLTDDQKAAFPEVPTSSDLIAALGITHHQVMEDRYASGEVTFDVTAPANSVYAKQVMLALTLYHGDNEVAKLYEQDEENLCITYPGISTEATVYGDHVAAATKNTVVVDAVSYIGLAPGVQYHLETMLVEKSTQSPVVDATTGETITMITEFVPQSSSGIVNVILGSFDATSLVGREVVVFEKLVRCVDIEETDDGAQEAANASSGEASANLHSTQKGQPAANHQDINDEYQTISFSKEEWEAGEVEQGSTLSNMGETPRPYIFGGLVIAALVGIGIMRMRQRMM